MARIVQMLIFLLAVSSSAATYVAVVETVAGKDVIGHSEKMFLTDRLRSIAQKSLPAYMDFVIMTRENINAMLPPGKSIEDCEGSCLAETGRNIAANYISQARVGKFGEKFTLTVELYETNNGNLIGSFTALSDNESEILKEIDDRAAEMFNAISAPRIEKKKDTIFVDARNIKSLGMVSAKAQMKNVEGKLYVADGRDGKEYRVVKVGEQIWMGSNLNYEKENSWCYENRVNYCDMYGRLYTASAAQNACPEGWGLPTEKELKQLISIAGGYSAAGKMLKIVGPWFGKRSLDKFGLTFQLGGYYVMGRSRAREKDGYYWISSNNKKMTTAWIFSLMKDSVTLKDYNNAENFAFSVRCIKK